MRGQAQDLSIYDRYSENWWAGDTAWLRTLQNMVPARMRFFDEHIGDWAGLDVLDLGCGGGFMAEAMARRGSRVTGVDPAVDALDAARRHAAQERLDITYVEGVGEALPFADSSHDVVVSCDALEHVRDLDLVLDEVARVLKPGALFLFDTINRNLLSRFIVVTMGERVLRLMPRGTHDPDLFIRPRDLRRRLLRRGFDVGRFRGFGPAGVDRRFTPTFTAMPLTTVLYLGAARKRTRRR